MNLVSLSLFICHFLFGLISSSANYCSHTSTLKALYSIVSFCSILTCGMSVSLLGGRCEDLSRLILCPQHLAPCPVHGEAHYVLAECRNEPVSQLSEFLVGLLQQQSQHQSPGSPDPPLAHKDAFNCTSICQSVYQFDSFFFLTSLGYVAW